MKRRAFLMVAAGCGLLALTGFSDEPADPPPALRLIVRLHRATGVVPLAPGEADLYTFEVSAFDERQGRARAGGQVFVRKGQTRDVQKKFRGVEVKGVVNLSDGSNVRYRAQLLENGVRTVATEAWFPLER
jgi:hypothetical protein